MNRILGNFRDELPVSQEGLTIVFSPTSLPLKQRWRNNGLSADFMADYFSTFFPGGENDSLEIGTQAELKSAVSFIANELLENAMKFNDETSPYPISIRLQMDKHVLLFLASNSINLQASEKFQSFITKLLNSNPSDLFIQHLEKSAAENDDNHSGLGLLTMVNDYCAKLGWKFETLPENPEVINVTTMVQLTL